MGKKTKKKYIELQDILKMFLMAVCFTFTFSALCDQIIYLLKVHAQVFTGDVQDPAVRVSDLRDLQ